ncbi:MAG: hypothetical protein ACYS67_05310 [Planctomycetota bacterium]|jgi:hypothetical protein
MSRERKVTVVLIEIFCIGSLVYLAGGGVGFGGDKFGDKSISSQPGWLESMRALTQSPRLVHSSKTDGDEDYYFTGDTSAFNEFLQEFGSVKLPRCRIVFKNQYGKVSHRHFDWVLHIPGHIDSTGEENREAEEAYPSVTVYTAASDIHLADVVLPEGADVVVKVNTKENHRKVDKDIETARKWAPARNKWLEFIGPYLSRIRQEENNPSIQYIEMRSDLFPKYLPQHRIYVIETTRAGRSSTFALSITGEITDLGRGDWMGRKDEKYFRNRKLSAFLSTQNIKISDPDTAIGITKLIEKISRAPQDVVILRQSTNNFRIFDKRLYPCRCRESNWRYKAKRRNKIWRVDKKYVGPPAMIMKPRKWEIVMDEKNHFVEMRFQ